MKSKGMDLFFIYFDKKQYFFRGAEEENRKEYYFILIAVFYHNNNAISERGRFEYVSGSNMIESIWKNNVEWDDDSNNKNQQEEKEERYRNGNDLKLFLNNLHNVVNISLSKISQFLY